MATPPNNGGDRHRVRRTSHFTFCFGRRWLPGRDRSPERICCAWEGPRRKERHVGFPPAAGASSVGVGRDGEGNRARHTLHWEHYRPWLFNGEGIRGPDDPR